MPVALALTVGDDSTVRGLLEEPEVLKLPDFVFDSDPLEIFRVPPQEAVEVLHPPGTQKAEESVVLQVHGAPCSNQEMQAISQLLRARAIGIEAAVYATDLEHYDAAALEM